MYSSGGGESRIVTEHLRWANGRRPTSPAGREPNLLKVRFDGAPLAAQTGNAPATGRLQGEFLSGASSKVYVHSFPFLLPLSLVEAATRARPKAGLPRS